MIRYRICLLVVVGGLCVGCFASADGSASLPLSAEDLAIAEEPLEIDLFSARGFLGGSDYERYHLKGEFLWRECGNVAGADVRARKRRSLAGDEVLDRDPNLVIGERRVETLSGNQAVAIKKAAKQFVQFYQNERKRHPLPGSVFSLSAPGMFELSIVEGSGTRRLVTSIDAVAEDDRDLQTETLQAAFDLFELLRGVGPVICNSRTFFGVGRKTI